MVSGDFDKLFVNMPVNVNRSLGYKLRCTICNAAYTCVHDDKCAHGILQNREDCPTCIDAVEMPKDVYTAERKQAQTEYNEWRAQRHLAPMPIMHSTEKRMQHGFKLSDGCFVGLLQTAQTLGYTADVTGKPNVTLLLEAIGQGLLIVTYPGANTRPNVIS